MKVSKKQGSFYSKMKKNEKKLKKEREIPGF